MALSLQADYVKSTVFALQTPAQLASSIVSWAFLFGIFATIMAQLESPLAAKLGNSTRTRIAAVRSGSERHKELLPEADALDDNVEGSTTGGTIAGDTPSSSSAQPLLGGNGARAAQHPGGGGSYGSSTTGGL